MAALVDLGRRTKEAPVQDIQTLTQAHRSAAIECLVLAFSADPLFRYAFPDPHTYLVGFMKFLRYCCRTSFDLNTAYASSDLRSVAIWSPPGERCEPNARKQLISATVPQHRQDALTEVFHQMDEVRPAFDHWYLSYLGVEPSAQGSGIGSVLMKWTLSIVDEAQLPAYLESSNPQNLTFYERHGFEAQDEIRCRNVPVITPMIRPPQPSKGRNG